MLNKSKINPTLNAIQINSLEKKEDARIKNINEKNLRSAPLENTNCELNYPKMLGLNSNSVWMKRDSPAFQAILSPYRKRSGSDSSKAGLEKNKESKGATTSNAIDVKKQYVINFEKINHPKNSIVRSFGGKTSGVFLVTDPKSGVTLAALKPVKEDEIFANKIFALLQMPIPKFEIVNKEALNGAIKKIIDESFKGKVINSEYKEMMVMEPIMGRALSEHNSEEIKKIFLNDENMKLLGKSMLLDMFIGNADRIIYFSAPVFNPDNIMVRNDSVVFIDQVFRSRCEQIMNSLKVLSGSVQAVPNENNSLFSKYMLPLVNKAFINQGKRKSGFHISQENNLNAFCASIDEDQRCKINENISSGIRDALQLLNDKKDEMLELDIKRRDEIKDVYNVLEAELAAFGVKK